MRTKNLADLYELAELDWDPIAARLDEGVSQVPGTGGPDRHTWWLATIDADGRPHVAGVGALWHDGALWFETGAATRKGRNVARDPRCTMSLAMGEYDLVVEGEAHRVADPDVVADLAVLWAVDWPCRVDESGIALTADLSAPSAGPPPWHVYRVTAHAATALLTVAPGGATRFTFD
ncbi:pyridoxamine 5'-phosphate oxidase family protein [Gordonia sp. SID5947]|uniref:pyridoxamine 5'-phosphate oxidase family protein n=1 Tax=Gordonia sp. SID5947 TaxID=2690315 RepID=UPI00136F919F|nr:pyridoxamine 5'-phosphate oxidase family protein [Gordonia sp. SID5947]MYR05892.1 pyridoxamine 5'-phosphate oxidase family protein [Gordonia sp. SID5947]